MCLQWEEGKAEVTACHLTFISWLGEEEEKDLWASAIFYWLSLFVFCSSQTSVFFSPLLSSPFPSQQLRELAEWQLHELSYPYTSTRLFRCTFRFSFPLCFNLTGWRGTPGRKGTQEALIITSCSRHLSPKVLCLLLPCASTQVVLTKKRKLDLILRNIGFPPAFLQLY